MKTVKDLIQQDEEFGIPINEEGFLVRLKEPSLEDDVLKELEDMAAMSLAPRKDGNKSLLANSRFLVKAVQICAVVDEAQPKMTMDEWKKIVRIAGDFAYPDKNPLTEKALILATDALNIMGYKASIEEVQDADPI